MALTNLNRKLNSLNSSYSRKPKTRKGLRRLGIIIIILLILLIIPSFFAFLGLKEAASHGKGIIEAYKLQNFSQMKTEISSTKSGLQKADFALNFLFWLKIIPILGGYYGDAKGFISAGVEELAALNTLFKKLQPFEKELGFDGHPKSGPDRSTQIVKIMDKSLPFVDEIQPNLTKAANFVKNIDVSKYPETFRGKTVRKNLEVAKSFIQGAAVGVSSGKDAIKLAPAALGIPTAKNYLLLFQNDKEIRATGGFLTAYATLTINNGQISATGSDDIYRLDEKLLEVCKNKICPLTPPAPIVKYLPEVTGKVRSAWSMRDSNLSPDVPTSAAQFESMYRLLGEGLPFDGIIFIDAQVVEELIEVTGPITVFDTEYSSKIDKRCNCPNVIYELEAYAEIAAKGEKDRKAVLGVLMQQIMARSIGADIEKTPQLLETIVRLANHKHIMFYMHDSALQKALSNLNWTGQIKQFDGDYLHINDSNFAGGKSNLYVEQTVTQDINKQSNGTYKKKLTIEYKNPQAFNSWLNGINRDYVRVYTPKGSKLTFSKGSDNPVTTIEDLDKTVFEAFIQVRPQNSRKLELEFTIPYKPSGQYEMIVQKQPGAKDFDYKIKLNGKSVADFELDQDKILKFGL